MQSMTWWADPNHTASALDSMKPSDKLAVEEFLISAQPYLRQNPVRVDVKDPTPVRVLNTGRRHWNPVALTVIALLATPIVSYGLTWWLLSTLGR